ncbi:MAG: hypothetical protein IJZ18_01420 [Mailhella sp.]|nr:hypothetical protein [Mailhella sp.]
MNGNFSRSEEKRGDIFPYQAGAGQASSDLRLDSARLKKMLGASFTGTSDEAWFSPLSFSLQEGRKSLSVKLPHELFFRWYSSVGKKALEKNIRGLLGSDISIRYEWPGKTASRPASSADAELKHGYTSNSSSFDDFIAGSRNSESVRLFRRCLSGKPCTVLLHGPSGSGKSHLLLAASSELGSSQKGKVIFLSGRELISLFDRSPALAHAALRSCAAVIADDIQLLEKHPAIQRELIALLDSLTKTFFIAAYQTDENDESGQKLMPPLYDRLCSYLSLGLTEPDLDIRLRFVQNSMHRMDIPENRGLALFIARKCLRLRHIRGILEQIRLGYEQNGRIPSEEDLSSLMVRSGTPQPVDVDSILSVVASRYGCTSSELCGKTKDSRLSLPRQIAMYLCRKLLGESYPSLGLIFGGKDHSTIMYSVRKIEKLRVTNKDAHIQLTELTKQCRNSMQRRQI